VSEYKRKNFLDLNNDDNQSICPMYSKNTVWLKHVGHSNSICIYLQDWSWITLLLANIGLDSFPKNSFYVCVESILLKQKSTFCLIVQD